MSHKSSELCEPDGERRADVEVMTGETEPKLSEAEAREALLRIKELADRVLGRKAEDKRNNMSRAEKIAAGLGFGEKGKELTGDAMVESLMVALERSKNRWLPGDKEIVEEMRKDASDIVGQSLNPGTGWEVSMVGEWAQGSGQPKQRVVEVLANLYDYMAYDLKSKGFKTKVFDDSVKAMRDLANNWQE